MSTAVGLDLSLTGTGLAIIRNQTSPAQVELTRLVSKGANRDDLGMRFARLRGLAGQIITTVLAARPEIVTVEQPAYSSSSGHVTDRSGLWWLVVGRLMALRLTVVEVPITARCTYATGKGRADKDSIMAAVVRRYGWVDHNMINNDTADALVIAAMASRWLGHPIEPGLPQLHLAAMTRVAWPRPGTTIS